MVDCPNSEIRDRLPDFVHDQLSATARASIAAHVASCAACAAEVTLLRELRATLRSGPALDIGRILAALPTSARAGRAPALGRGAWMRLDWRIAAAVAALVVGGGSAAVLSGRLGEPDAPSRVAPQAPPEATRPRVQEVAADLSIDADLAEASVVELEALLDELEAFDGLPANDPEPPPASPATGAEDL